MKPIFHPLSLPAKPCPGLLLARVDMPELSHSHRLLDSAVPAATEISGLSDSPVQNSCYLPRAELAVSEPWIPKSCSHPHHQLMSPTQGHGSRSTCQPQPPSPTPEAISGPEPGRGWARRSWQLSSAQFHPQLSIPPKHQLSTHIHISYHNVGRRQGRYSCVSKTPGWRGVCRGGSRFYKKRQNTCLRKGRGGPWNKVGSGDGGLYFYKYHSFWKLIHPMWGGGSGQQPRVLGVWHLAP